MQFPLSFSIRSTVCAAYDVVVCLEEPDGKVWEARLSQKKRQGGRELKNTFYACS